MHFVIDESVNRRVCELLAELGYKYILSVDVLGQHAPDLHVARLADDRQAIVVDCNYKDFKAYVSRRPENNQMVLRKIGGRISLRCKPSRSRERLSHVFELIKLEWEHRKTCSDRRLIADVHDDHIRIYR